MLYVISGFATMALGDHLDGDLLPHFDTIPASMFTAFRCFTGECVSDQGPLTLVQSCFVLGLLTYLVLLEPYLC